MFEKYDCFELSLVGEITPGILDTIHECFDIETYHSVVFSVYGHLKTGGVECLAEFDTFKEAKNAIALFKKMKERFK